ncbi:hypothetical protein V6N13_002196 [Hibiscus sabdariffa]
MCKVEDALSTIEVGLESDIFFGFLAAISFCFCGLLPIKLNQSKKTKKGKTRRAGADAEETKREMILADTRRRKGNKEYREKKNITGSSNWAMAVTQIWLHKERKGHQQSPYY